MNPLKEKDFNKLCDAIEWSLKQFETPRRNRITAIRQYVGSHYSEGGTEKRVPVNFLKLAVDIYVRQLAARAPRAMITVKRPDLKPTAANLELAINQIPDEIDLTMTMRRLVTEALFSLGVVKVGLSTTDQALGHNYGKSFVDNITLDDYFCDMSAKRHDMIQFEGNDYWMNYEELMEAEWVDKSARDDIKPDEYTVLGPGGEERADSIGSQQSGKTFRDRVWLRDVWLPTEGLVCTYRVKSRKLLNTVEWNSTGHGPYYKLAFCEVPGNLLPLPLVSVWRDLHELGNALFRKLGAQADSQKTVQGFSGNDDQGVENLQKAADGSGIKYNGSPPVELKVGGVDAKTLAFFMQTRDLYSYFAGNLDSLGGLQPQAQTLGQDKLLGDAAGAQLRDMVDGTVRCAREIFRALAWYEWHDPLSRRTLQKPVPGTDISLSIDWHPGLRQGNFSDYELTIDVYSLQDDSPSLKLQRLGAVMQQYVIPLMPFIQQAGGQVDAQAILSLVAKYTNLPELNDVVVFAETNLQQQTESAGMPANTSREYVRVGRPGMTRQGASSVMQQQLMGKEMQNSEAMQVASMD